MQNIENKKKPTSVETGERQSGDRGGEDMTAALQLGRGRGSPQPTAHGPAAEHPRPQLLGRGLRPRSPPIRGGLALGASQMDRSTEPSQTRHDVWAGIGWPAFAPTRAAAPLHPTTDPHPPSSSCSIPRTARKISSAASGCEARS